MMSEQIQKVWSAVHNRFGFYDSQGNRLPELSIIDISDIPQELDRVDIEDIFKIWEWIQTNITRLLREFDFASVEIVEHTEFEIRLVSNDITILRSIRNQILFEAISELGIKKQKQKLNLMKVVECKNSSILETFKKDYSKYGPRKGLEDKFKLYSGSYAREGSVWNEVAKLGSSYVFVAHSGVPFLRGFYNTTKNKNLCLTEYHHSHDPYEKYRKAPLVKEFISTLTKKDLDRPIIIDRSYTGNTLKYLKDSMEGSRTVALFPKTESSIRLSDYFIINNKLFNSKDVNCNKKSWYFNLIRESLSV